MKNAGVGVGLPDKGRAKLVVHDGKVELYSAASDIGQGCATVFVQMVAETTGLGKEMIINKGANSEVARTPVQRPVPDRRSSPARQSAWLPLT